jgi:hypothetical protein
VTAPADWQERASLQTPSGCPSIAHLYSHYVTGIEMGDISFSQTADAGMGELAALIVAYRGVRAGYPFVDKTVGVDQGSAPWELPPLGATPPNDRLVALLADDWGNGAIWKAIGMEGRADVGYLAAFDAVAADVGTPPTFKANQAPCGAIYAVALAPP